MEKQYLSLPNNHRQSKKKKDDNEAMGELRGQGITSKPQGKGGVQGVGLVSLPEIQTVTPKVTGPALGSTTNRRKDPEKGHFDMARRSDYTINLMQNTGANNPLRANPQAISNQLPQINLSSPRKDPSYDYVSLGQRIQEQMKSQGQGRSAKKTQSQQPNSRQGGRSGSRQIMTPTNYNPDGTMILAQMPQVENYLKKVIKSVERRKQKIPSLSGYHNQTQRLTGLMELEYATAPQVKGGPLALTNNPTTYKNFSSSIVQGNQSQLLSQSALIEMQKQPGKNINAPFKYTEVAIPEESRDESQLVIQRSEKAESLKSATQSVKGAHPYQVQLWGQKTVFEEPKATEQVAYLLREAQKKDKIFIPLEKSTDVSSGYMYKEMKNAPENHAGIVVFSKQGFVNVGKEKGATSDFVSNEEFIKDGVNSYILKEIPFFKKFQIMKLFKQWKYIMRWNAYQRKRDRLAESFFFAKPIFSSKFSELVTNINVIRTLPLMEIKPNIIYGKKQQSLLEDKCQDKLDQSKKDLERVLSNIKTTLKDLKEEIKSDDQNFEKGVKEMRVQALVKQKRHGEELVMFSRARKQKEEEEEQYRIQKIRHIMYDKFVEMVLKFVCGNLVEVLFENKRLFRTVFRDLKNGPQFEVSICFNNTGVLDTDPSMEDHHCSFLTIFENMETSVYKNQNLIEFINDIMSYLYKEKQVYYKNIFKAIQTILEQNVEHKNNHDQIFDNLAKDIKKCREYLEQFITLQEIYDFSKNWEDTRRERQISSDMGFYKETWLLMDRYNLMIDKIPGGNLKLGTILVETQSLKKYLAELPKRVIDSIRHNVTLTMETETKSLREELSKTSEILDQLPTSLNVYVEQVNTLKYVKEKQDDFSMKFQTINKLHQLCKQDNIKVSMTLQLAIDEVSHLYESLPKLQRTAAEGLNQNKDTMEKIMQSSSLVLSKKIKAFEKKYVETYLQDKTRVDDQAIHEIRSKVILYKEFLKLLYEDDPRAQEKLKQNKLQCADDYEFVQSLHKETIKLWKMLLYWKKRRQMCYNTPFLQLDTNKIIRSINKVNKYFEEKLAKNDFIRDRARPLCKMVILQVKETSLIIEFLKDLRRDSLQQRHWLQIFNLIKAPHLKNSSNFTIVNLREYHIQNYREEIQAIIEHANTELKYEKIFRSIKEEWDNLELKIIPYKETMDAYILVNTDTLSNAIEENLTTLEAIAQSAFASHVKGDIDDWVKTLKIMLKNLEIWVAAQKYWINLDPIFQSTQLEDILKDDQQKFQEYRSQFKRIMWSAFKNPKATYNLMIQNRIEVFENLISYFSVLQKKVHEYLEERRLSFPRFFFLSDSQFLDFLTLANSNQDFNEYINLLFQGAQKLYINRILGQKKENTEDLESLREIDGGKGFLELPSLMDDTKEFREVTPYLKKAANQFPIEAKQQNHTLEIETISQNEEESQMDTIQNSPDTKMRDSIAVSDDIGGTKLGLLKQGKDKGFQVLGMISPNKEMFLFEKPVSMKNGVEKWLGGVEEAMQETVARMINYAVSSFPKQSLDEWILDYPQQVIVTTIHLILSHEINELLEEMSSSSKAKDDMSMGKKSDDEDDDMDDDASDMLSNATPNGMNKSKLKSKRSNLSSAGHNTFSKKSSKRNVEDEEDQAMKEYLKKKNELKAAQQAEEEEQRRKQLEEMRQKMEANEVPKDLEKEKRKFVDEMFGRDFPTNSEHLQESQTKENKEHEEGKDSKPAIVKKPEFKEIVMNLLQKKSFQGLYLRLQFWINQIIKSLFTKYRVSEQELELNIEINSLQKMTMKSIVTFLLFQREIVENLMKHNVTDQNDFEWQSQIRLLWTGIEPGCRVDCGGWSTYQQNEFLGTHPRLTLTPLTNKYFIFISAALREKSAVLFKCAPSQQTAGDIFQEFSNICSVPSRQFLCSKESSMKILLQYLNGAALASVWVFFEHIDKMSYLHLQAFNKEIQMVQQQFIIAELAQGDQQNQSQDKRSRQGQVSNLISGGGMYTSETQSNQKIVSQLSMDSHVNFNTKSKVQKKDETPFTKTGKICFGVFSSISHGFLINQPEISSSVMVQIQSAFRPVSLTRPSEVQLFKYLLKHDGFDHYDSLADCLQLSLDQFYTLQSNLLEEKKITNLQIHEQIELRDLRVISKLAFLLFEQDIHTYNANISKNKELNKKREYLGKSKTKDEKLQEIDEEDRMNEFTETERLKIEMNCVREAFKMVCIQKFFNLWRVVYTKDETIQCDQNEIEANLDSALTESVNLGFKKLQISQDVSLKSSLTSDQQLLIKKANMRRKSLSNIDVIRKYTSTSGLGSLIYNTKPQEQDRDFITTITQSLKDVAKRLCYDKVNSQLRCCINFLEYMRRMRGIVLVGPICSGKTSILKLVSNALNMAYGIKMRTSVINSVTYQPDELYGALDAFSKSSTKEGEQAGNFGNGGIFQIIMDVFDKERQSLKEDEQQHLIQSLFLDSCEIDNALSESLAVYLEQANGRESQRNQNTLFLMELGSGKWIKKDGQRETIPVVMPNGNQVLFPADLYMFFETPSIKKASPGFISKVGLVMTEEEDIDWKSMSLRLKTLFYYKHSPFFEDQNLNGSKHLDDFMVDFFHPFLDQLMISPKFKQWPHFNIKSSIIQFYTILNSIFYRFADVCRTKKQDDDGTFYLIKECERDVFWSSGLLSCIWSFGACLNKELRKIFEETFFNYRRKFNINVSGPGRQRFTLFDIYYDPEAITWDLLSEKLEYKLKLHHNPMTNQLLIPSTEVSQSYFLMDMLLSTMKFDSSLDKHFRILGPSATSKSTALLTFAKKFQDDYISVIVPMSSYLTLDKLKSNVEKHYIPKRRNQLEPADPHKRVVLLIDDLHLQTNIRLNVLEFIRTWCVSKGYYDIQRGYFKNIGEFATISAENSDYRGQYCKADDKTTLKSRFLFYTSTLYVDEFDFDKYKIFIQHWLTSKMWSTSKLVNKYYILMTNTVMALFDKLKRQEYFHNSHFLRLTNFHIFTRFCANLVNYTLITDDPKEIIIKGQKEEDSMAAMMLYELCRSIGDRIMLPQHRTAYVMRVLDSCKQEFVSGAYLTKEYIDHMVLGNYHNRRTGAHIKYIYQNNELKALRDEIRQKIRKCSNNHYLESFLDAPNGPKEIFRLSRILFKEMQHLLLVGQPGCGMIEYLQLAAILNDGLVFELNASQYNDALRFESVFKQAIISAVTLNSFSFIVINDQQLRDPIYIDYAYNFIVNMFNNETCVLLDEGFRQQLIDIEREIQMNSGYKKMTQPNNDILLLQALRKIQKNVHVVFMISELSTYFEWVSLFPGLESKCEMIFMDELSSEGYRQLTQEFLSSRDTDAQALNDLKLVKSLVEARQIAKHKILNLFYSTSMLQYTSNEDYMGIQAGEYIFNSDSKMHGFIFNNGNFNVQDALHKQLNYNMPIEICSLYKTRYIQFLELFRFLYDFLSMNLVIRRNYYETFLRKASEFVEFFQDIKKTKTTLHGEQNQITYKLVTLKDKIHKIQQVINDKEGGIARRLKDISDLEIELKNNRDELNSVIFEKDQMIEEILDHLEKINGSEFTYIISTRLYKPNEQSLLNILAIVIEQDARAVSYVKSEHDMYFLNREELINILNDRRNYEFDSTCFNRLKEFVNQFTANDYKDKPLLKQIFNYMMELYRKLNVRNTMSNTYSRIKEIKEQIDSNHFSINYSRQFIDDKKEEMEGLKSKFERISDQEHSLSKRIEEAEISHMRTEHIFIQVEKYTNKIFQKLTEIKRRIDTLMGDCVIMAASVSFLGALSFKERMLARKEIFDYVNNGCAIKCSPYWNEANPANNNNTKIFKSVIKEYGLRKQIQHHNFSGILSQPCLVEALFVMMFAPSCPYIIDPTGQLQEFMQNKLLQGIKLKRIYASDSNINSKVESILRSTQFSLLNDLNSNSKQTFGMSLDEPLLYRLTSNTYNGFDFDYERLQKLKQQHTLGAFHNSYNSVNKRIPTHTPEFENLSFYQVQIFSPSFMFQLNKEYMSKVSMFVAIDDQQSQSAQSLIQAPWVEIKELMLKHFLPEEQERIIGIKSKLAQLEMKQSELNKRFENAFLVANQDTLQNIDDYSLLKQSVEDIRYSLEERKVYQQNLQDALNEHSLLSSYANVISIMYFTLKKLSKISSEVTYSWKMFLSIIDQILAKTVRDLQQNMLNVKTQNKTNQSTESLNQSQKSQYNLKDTKKPQPNQPKEFTIDEEFFSTVIIPAIHGTLISGLKQYLIPLYNLILSFNISLKKKEINEAELEFFFKQLFLLKDFHKWRNTDHEFIDIESKIEKTKFYAFKREILKVYPESGRKVMEYIEKELGQTFMFKKASLLIYGKIFIQNTDFKDLTLMQKINLGFLCPDHEFKSKLCQQVYEQLSSIFQFNEEPIKLHHFIKTASWHHPIALCCQNQINLINTVCSIASFYGVGLEVIRTDQVANDIQQEKKNMNQDLNEEIKNRLIDYSYPNDDVINTYKQCLNKDAASLDSTNQASPGTLSVNANPTKVNLNVVQMKEGLIVEDKNLNGTRNDLNPLQMVEQSALNGSWVFISTLKFPSFWHKMCSMLDDLKKKGKIQNTFRVFIDLQGYQQNEIPESFMFNHAISFYLSEYNNEDMEGFNDIWANILNDKILTELTNYERITQAQLQQSAIQDKENDEEGIQSQVKMLLQELEHNNEQVAKQDSLIQNEKQRDLYRDFLRNNMIEESKNSNTLIFGSDLNEEIIDKKQSSKESQPREDREQQPDQFSHLDDILNDIRSLASATSKERNPVIGTQGSKKSLGQDEEEKDDHHKIGQMLIQEEDQAIEDIEQQEEDEVQRDKISRIDSVNNSVDISRGENALIQELQSQLHTQKDRATSSQSKRGKTASREKQVRESLDRVEEEIVNQPEVDGEQEVQDQQIPVTNKEEEAKEIQVLEQELAHNEIQKQVEAISEREAEEAFEEFNQEVNNQQVEEKEILDDTSELI